MGGAGEGAGTADAATAGAAGPFEDEAMMHLRAGVT